MQVGPRPYYLVDDLAPGPLEDELAACGDGPFTRTDFSTYWIENEPAFGAQAAFLDERVDVLGGYDAPVASLPDLAALGVRIVAPPTWALVALDAEQRIVPSSHARAARAAGLDLITWTLERSGPLATGGGYYFQSVSSVIGRDSDALVLLDVLARQVRVRGVFADWPATVTYYANCVGL